MSVNRSWSCIGILWRGPGLVMSLIRLEGRRLWSATPILHILCRFSATTSNTYKKILYVCRPVCKFMRSSECLILLDITSAFLMHSLKSSTSLWSFLCSFLRLAFSSISCCFIVSETDSSLRMDLIAFVLCSASINVLEQSLLRQCAFFMRYVSCTSAILCMYIWCRKDILTVIVKGRDVLRKKNIVVCVLSCICLVWGAIGTWWQRWCNTWCNRYHRFLRCC